MIEVCPGAYHFKNGLSGLLKTYLRVLVSETENETNNKFYVPKLKTGHYMNLNMLCLGKHWSAVDYGYHETRIDIDRATVPPVPQRLQNIAGLFSTQCFPYHNPEWDVCIINKYAPVSTLGMHVDNSESKAALDIGHPVVSFSIGGACVFKMGEFDRKSPYREIILEDGDVFVFGGPSRLRYHGVAAILDNEERINFTLRKL